MGEASICYSNSSEFKHGVEAWTIPASEILCVFRTGEPDPQVIDTLMKRFRLEDLMEARLAALTDTQKRMVSLIAALSADTSLLVLIEPLAGIDEEDIDLVRTLRIPISVRILGIEEGSEFTGNACVSNK